MKQREFREMVNELLDIAIKYHAHEELRERIVHVLWAHEIFHAVSPHQQVKRKAQP